MSDAKEPQRPLPKPDIYTETAPFWQAAKDGKLMVQYCTDSGRHQWLPRPVSIYTGKQNLEWREVSGDGTLYSFTRANVPWPGHQDRVPYLCGIVELDEGVRMVSNLINCEYEDLEVGMKVKLAWETLNEEFEFPVFEPA